MMRVTNTMIRSNTKSNINGNKLLVDLYNTQMTTQKKITKPSDNPVIAIRSLRLSTTLSHLNQYLDKNIEDANAWLDVTFTALNNTKVVLNDIHTACNKGANGPLTAEDRKTILSSLKSSVEQVYADGDADYSGRTVFTGYRTNKHLTFMEDSKDTTYLINESATYKDFTTKRYYSEPITVPNVVDANTAMCNAPVTETEYKSIRLAYGDIDEDNLILDIKDKNGNQINLSKNYTTEQEWEQYCGGKVVADDEIIFIRETGEFIFGKEIADQISRDDLSINISYQKTGFEGSEVRPEYYFDCVDVTRCKEAATGKVDTTSQLYKDNKIEYVPRPQADLDKIADLVRGGLGLSESRGDFVKVETVSFPHGDITPELPVYQQDWFIKLVKPLAVILIVLIVVVFVIRPLLNKLLRKDETDVPEVDQDELDSQSALDGFDDFNLIAKNKELADQVYTINTEGGIELPNLRKEADLLKAVRTLASNEPQLTAEVIKDWLAEDLKEKS